MTVRLEGNGSLNEPIPTYPMLQVTHLITSAVMHVAQDLGHGGPSSLYSLDTDGRAHSVTLRISRSLPAPGESHFEPMEVTETLEKDAEKVEAFIQRLSNDFKVYELASLKP